MIQTPLSFPDSPKALSVSQINQQARLLLEGRFARVQVAGEISNLKIDRSGHHYLSLKDPTSTLSAAMFRREAQTLRFAIENGLQVIATGSLTIYGPSGRYQLVVQKMQLQGAGALQAAFDALKMRLQQEGLFDTHKKRKLPMLPRRVAVLTSPHGAVLRDILHVSRRRFPNADVVLIPARVQGIDCAAQIEAGIQLVSRYAKVQQLDVLIIARGGGSLEDLWGFNDERVARAVAHCSIPVVSAVGHETDFTICDFVADVRAPTPSAAAELVFPVKQDLHEGLAHLKRRQRQALVRDIQQYRYRLQALMARVGDGRRSLWPHAQRLGNVAMRCEQSMRNLLRHKRRYLQDFERRLHAQHPRARLNRLRLQIHQRHTQIHGCMRHILYSKRHLLEQWGTRIDIPKLIRRRQDAWQHLQKRLAAQNPRPKLVQLRGEILRQKQTIRHITQARLQQQRQHLHHLLLRLAALNPQNILDRGYALVLDKQGQVVRNKAQAPAGTQVQICLAHDRLQARIET